MDRIISTFLLTVLVLFSLSHMQHEFTWIAQTSTKQTTAKPGQTTWTHKKRSKVKVLSLEEEEKQDKIKTFEWNINSLCLEKKHSTLNCDIKYVLEKI